MPGVPALAGFRKLVDDISRLCIDARRDPDKESPSLPPLKRPVPDKKSVASMSSRKEKLKKAATRMCLRISPCH